MLNSRKQISNAFYKHFGEVIAETIWFGGCRNPERLHRKRLVEYTNLDTVEAALAESPGVVVLNSHFGNWELTGGCLTYDYRPDSERSKMEANDIIAVYKPLSSKMWDEIMRVNRCAPVLRDGCAVQKKLGGSIEVILKPGCDHHPHSL